MRRFGRYQLIRKLGAGGMAEVYLARAATLHGLEKQLVIKLIRGQLAERSWFVSRFIDEAQIALALDHPNIVQVFDFGRVEKTYFLAMEHVAGVDAQRLLETCRRRGRPIPYALAALIGEQACRGLDHAHRRCDASGDPLGIVHRDVSPQNLLLSREGAVKVADFGIARARDSLEQSRGQSAAGKSAYMSPEQIANAALDGRSDVFSLAIVILELALTRPLLSSLPPATARAMIAGGELPRPSTLDPGFPPQLELLLLRALAVRPADRFPTAAAMADALRGFVHAQPEIHDARQLAQLVREIAALDAARGEERPARLPTTRLQPLDRGRRPSERKHVVLLAGVLHGVSRCNRQLGPEATQRLLGSWLQLVDNISFKHRIQVSRLDDAALLLVLGLPFTSEDDAARAVRLAEALTEALAALCESARASLSLACGIQRGTALVGRGATGELQFQLDVATQELAQALAAEAMPGEVLLGGSVYRACQGDFRCDPLPHEVVSRGGRSLRAYRLLGPDPAARGEIPGAPPTFVGRQLELRRLHDLFREVTLTASARQLALVGEAGIGKRTLVTAFIAQIAPEAHQLVQTTARTWRAHPFGLAGQLLHELLDLPTTPSEPAIASRVEQVLSDLEGVLDADRRHLLRRALSLGLATTPRRPLDDALDRRPPAEEQQLLALALRELMRWRSGRAPLLIVIGAWQAVDSASREIIADLLREASGSVLLLVLSRPGPAIRRTVRAGGYGHGDWEVLELGELDPRASEELVARRLGESNDAARLAHEILHATGGNPLFITEMIDMLVERGVLARLRPDGPLRRVDQQAELLVPTTVEGVIAARLDRLPAELRGPLVQLSVLEDPFDVQLFARLTSGGDDALPALVTRCLLTPTAGERYTFANPLLRRVALQLLPGAARARLHQRAAAALAATDDERHAAATARVAWHLERAGDLPLAANSYVEAARAACDRRADTAALHYYQRAAALLPKRAAPLAIQVCAEHERLLATRGQLRARRPLVARMLALSRELGDPRWEGLAQLRSAELALEAGDEAAAEEALARLRRQLRSGGRAPVELQGACRLLQAQLLRRRGAIDEAAAAVEAGLAACAGDRTAAALQLRATLLHEQGALLARGGSWRQALRAETRALLIWFRLGDQRRVSFALEATGRTLFALGDVDSALALLRRALAAAPGDDPRAVGARLLALGLCYAEVGAPEQALPCLRRALRLAQARGADDGTAAVLTAIGRLLRRCGRARAAREALERALTAAAGDDRRRARALAELAYTQVVTRRPAALAVAQEARRLADAVDPGETAVLALAAVALAQNQQGDHRRALDLSGAAVAAARDGPLEGVEEVFHARLAILEQTGDAEQIAALRRLAATWLESRAARIVQQQWRERYLQRFDVRRALRALEPPAGRAQPPT